MQVFPASSRIFTLLNRILTMNIFQKLTDTIRETINIDTHIDTDAAEKSIRGNIEFRGPNAWILAVAIIIASVGLNVNSIPVIIGAMLIYCGIKLFKRNILKKIIYIILKLFH